MSDDGLQPLGGDGDAIRGAIDRAYRRSGQDTMSAEDLAAWERRKVAYDRELVRQRIRDHREAMLVRELGERWTERTFATYREMPGNRAALAQAKAVVASGFTLGAAFCGEAGNGKTHLAGAIVHAAIDAGKSARFVTAKRLVDVLIAGERDGTQREVLWSYTGVDVLALDDLGKESQSAWAATTLFEAVNARYESRRPMIVTANMGLEKLIGFYGRERQGRADIDDSTGSAMLDRILSMVGGPAGFVRVESPSQRWSA